MPAATKSKKKYIIKVLNSFWWKSAHHHHHHQNTFFIESISALPLLITVKRLIFDTKCWLKFAKELLQLHPHSAFMNFVFTFENYKQTCNLMLYHIHTNPQFIAIILRQCFHFQKKNIFFGETLCITTWCGLFYYTASHKSMKFMYLWLFGKISYQCMFYFLV